jgi:7,8-dihydropterin-6-yl-methyl-4-(beta-D-ribofuranosyl)aminobenzene 5'-phosphate synthase
MERRDFLKAMSATGAVAATGSALMPVSAEARGTLDVGEVKSVKVDVLSETSWFENDRLKKNIVDYGGAATNQYTIPWDADNAGGYAALITVTTLDGEEKKILMDSGWSNEWMDYIFEMNGIPEMLQNGEIEFMVLTHWHLDHLWGIESTLKHNPNIKMFAPATYYPEDMALLKEKAHHTVTDRDGNEILICKNDVSHTGELVLCTAEGEGGEGIYKPMPGMAIKMYDVPILLRVRGENVLYFNVKDKGIVTVTGCCHPGVLTLFSFARRNFKDYQPYGCYGGLHLTLFETWDPKFDDVIRGVKSFKLKKVACNHCTGWLWAEKAAAAGVPIVKGTDKYKTYKRQSSVAKTTNVFLTNGDTVTF